MRFCIDFRQINALTEPIASCLPRIDDALDNVQGANWLTSLDTASAYWSIKVADASKPLTAFTAPDNSQYQFKRMPFGLKNSSQVFGQLMSCVLKDLNWECCTAYADDTLIHTRGSFQEHVNDIDKVLTRFIEHNVQLKASKCDFATTSTRYLGYVVDGKGVSIDPHSKSTRAIREMPTPSNQKELRGFLGLANFFRRWIPHFAKTSAPLQELLKKNGWQRQGLNKEQLDAVETLKDAITSDKVMCHPQYDKQFEVHCDASPLGLGCCLMQRDHEGYRRPIKFLSRSLRGSESSYHQNELEMLSCIWGIESLRGYLLDNTFLLVSDHSALKRLETNPEQHTGRQLRWVLRLSEYSFKVEIRKGSQHLVPDCLSRAPLHDDNGATVEALLVREIEDFTPEENLKKEIILSQPDDEEIQKIITKTLAQQETDTCNCAHAPGAHEIGCSAGERNLFVESNVLYHRKIIKQGTQIKHVTRLYVPKSWRKPIMRLHGTVMHLGRKGTLDQIAQLFYWKGISKEVRKWVRACVVCFARKQPQPKSQGAPGTYTATRPFQFVSVDVVGPFAVSRRNNKFILTMVDGFLRWPLACAIPNLEADTIVQAINENLIQHHTTPEAMVFDNAKYFTSSKTKALCKALKTKMIMSMEYTPHTNSKIERFHRFLGAALTAITSRYKDNWCEVLWSAVMVYRVATNHSTGMSPFFSLYGRFPRLAIHNLMDEQARESDSASEYTNQTRRILRSAYKQMRKNQAKIAQRNHDAQAQKLTPKVFEQGDFVMVWDKNVELMPNTVPAVHKLLDRWRGPYECLKMEGFNNTHVAIQNAGQKEIIHVSRVSQYFPFTDTEPSIPRRAYITKADRTEMNAEGRTGEKKFKPPQPQQLVVFPLETNNEPGFGVAKVIQKAGDQYLCQWYGNSQEELLGTYRPFWKDSQGQAYIGNKRHRMHTAYTTRDTHTSVLSKDMEDVGFKLMANNKLPRLTLERIAEHPSFAWQMP